MFNPRSWTVICAIFGLSAVLAGCNGCKNSDSGNGGQTSTGSGGNTILVGEYGSMTGSEAAFGQSTNDGVQLAVDEINKAGGGNGKQVEIGGPGETGRNNQKAGIAVKGLFEKKEVAVI